jgi:V8-like Glu-specific endopeptidase
MRIASAILTALVAWQSPALAEDSPLKTLTTADDTKGWEAVGRLNMGESGFCTGALIAPSLVLTAAHCLYDKKTGAAYDPSRIEFLAGWRNGRAAAYRGVRRAIPHPDYVYEGPEKMDRVSYDLAVLELDQPIRLPSIQPFETDTEPKTGDAVGVVSYALDRSEAPSLQDGCHVLERQTGILILSCDVNFGSSGAPVFTLKDGRARIVSVVSAKAEMNSQIVALGTMLETPLATLMAEVASDTSGYRRAGSATKSRFPTITQGEADVSAGGETPDGARAGAKFVKP